MVEELRMSRKFAQSFTRIHILERKRSYNDLAIRKFNIDDIRDVKIKRIHFAKCPIKGWFVNHWALIFERIDQKYITL